RSGNVTGVVKCALPIYIYIATKTPAKTGEAVKKDLETSLSKLKTDYIDIYQLHCAPKCFRPGEADGVYDAMVEAKKEGKIRHIEIGRASCREGDCVERN